LCILDKQGDAGYRLLNIPGTLTWTHRQFNTEDLVNFDPKKHLFEKKKQ